MLGSFYFKSHEMQHHYFSAVTKLSYAYLFLALENFTKTWKCTLAILHMFPRNATPISWTGQSELGGMWAGEAMQSLADTSTLFQSGGGIMPKTLLITYHPRILRPSYDLAYSWGRQFFLFIVPLINKNGFVRGQDDLVFPVKLSCPVHGLLVK